MAKFYFSWGMQGATYQNRRGSRGSLITVKKKKMWGKIHITAPHLVEIIKTLPNEEDIYFRGFRFQRSGNALLYVETPYLTCKAHCYDAKTAPPCNSKCPVARAFQGLLTKLRQRSASKNSPNPGELFEADPELPSPDASASDKMEGASSGEASRSLPEEPQSSTGAGSDCPEKHSESAEQSSLEDVQAGEAEGGEATPEAPQPEADIPDGLDAEIVQEMLAEAEEVKDCLNPSVSSRPEAEGKREADGAGGSAPASASEGAEQPSKKDGCVDSADGGKPSEEHPAGARTSGPEESRNGGAGRDSSPSLEGSEVSDTSSENLWEMATNPEEDPHAYGGGGAQAASLSARAAGSLEKQVTLLLRRFFSEVEDVLRKEDGRDFWEARKVIYSSMLAPHQLLASKFSRPKGRKISLWIDISGSVSYLSTFIINIITAACKDKNIQVVIGSEAHPQTVLPYDFVRSGKTWREYFRHAKAGQYIWEFDQQVEHFFRKHPLERGSTIVVWSDYMDIHANNLDRLARLFKPYKVIWLCSHSPEKSRHYSGNESFKLERFARKQGHLFLWGVDSPEGIKEAIRKLSIRRVA